MAKFWRTIRNIVQNIPIPGVGISVQQAKDIGTTIKQEPGGTITYTPPSTPSKTGELTFEYQRFNMWFIAAVVAGIYILFSKAPKAA